MPNKALILPHPVEQLEMYDLDPAKWDCLHPPDLFVVGDPALVPPRPYMPPLWQVEVERNVGVEFLEDGRCNHTFRLNCEVNEIWLQCFKQHRANDDAVFDRNVLVVSCGPKDVQKIFGEIAHDQIPKATNDYRKERDNLVCRIFHKMKEQERRDATEGEIQTELASFRQRQQQCASAAQENGWSVSFVVQNHNERCREILENKFVWWSKVLDETMIRKYRALFEQELLLV